MKQITWNGQATTLHDDGTIEITGPRNRALPEHDENCWTDGAAWHCADGCSVAKWSPLPPQPDAPTIARVAQAARLAASQVGGPAAAALLQFAEALESK